MLLKLIHNKRGIRRWIGPKRIILLLCLAGFFLWAWSFYQSGAISPLKIEQYLSQHPIRTVLLFILFYVISVIVVLPSLPFNLAAGFFWGGLVGGLYSAIGVTLGGWVSFLMARWLIGQPLADQFENKWITLVQDQFKRNGWKFVAFARINPIIPTGPLNYLLGLTSLSNREFLWTTFVFISLPSIAVAYIGDILQTFTVHQVGVSEIIRGSLFISAAVTFLVFLKVFSNIYKKGLER